MSSYNPDDYEDIKQHAREIIEYGLKNTENLDDKVAISIYISALLSLCFSKIRKPQDLMDISLGLVDSIGVATEQFSEMIQKELDKQEEIKKQNKS